MLLYVLLTRILLPSRKIINPIRNGTISKHQGSWYYVKCPKKMKNCNDIIKSSLKFDIDYVGIPMKQGLYSIYMTRSEAEIAIKNNLKIEKIPKSHKISRGIIVNGSNQYLVLSTQDCELPFKVQDIGMHGKLFITDENPEIVFEKLYKIPCVRSFEHVPHSHLNTRFTKSIAHAEIPMYYNKSGFSYSLRNFIYEHGIGGHGQVVSIVDTGLDHNLCWFSDPDQPRIMNEDLSGLDHRKILSYFRYEDDKDIDGGHGTFISSIIAGQAMCKDEESLCSGSLYDGVAPMAKIIMSDIFKDKKNNVMWPKNLTDLFIIPRFMSAAVQYHAFDFQMQSYFTYLMDQIAYFFPQMLLLFAAGENTNSNDNYLVSSPGDSKNVLTVGATQSAPFSLNQIDPASPVIIILKEKEYLGFCDPFAGITWMEMISRDEFLRKPLKYKLGDSEREFFIDIDGNETDVLKFQESFGILSFHSKEYKNKIKRPIIRLPHSVSEDFSNGDIIKIKPFEENHLRHTQLDYHHINPNARGGYVKIGRIKPEIVMPGGPVLGANAGSSGKEDSCGPDGLRVGEGSSVAAAFATGDIMLIRQYLKHGFYPTGTKKKENTINTSNHMIKAILSNIAQPVKGDPQKTGFGMPQLDRFIIFPDTYKKSKNEIQGFRFFSDEIPSNSYNAYRFKSSLDGPLVASLAWNDPPHDPHSPSDVLFRIDLRIEDDQDSLQKVGNRKDDSSYFDAHNTLKRIKMNVRKNTVYTIYVVSGDLLHHDKCQYTLAISAPFDHFVGIPPLKVFDAIEPKCGAGCEGSATCKNGYCICPKGRIGDLCGSESHPMKTGMKHEEDSLPKHEFIYYTFKFIEWKKGSSLVINMKHDIKKKLYYMFSLNEPPSWDHAHCSSGHCNWVSESAESITLEYEYWDFIEKDDVLHFVIFTFDDVEMSVTTSFTYNYK
ncbi:hypothetical protein TRFO_23650 [Tritrichomonas foetus]|uniref:Peptidase S8/S53 domain-containing protein n=1 Tax=Tritrichomonas foetus TaxID=1144522 RepID=A0A1J4KAV2_9EUKA|nr:hypothetical protein TRFO_23650 [Tritrichomonas foetus]|eukprot:OHT08024.1 hypothetical protein TRFO_23650 [Tritrichomonas foetus]